MRVKGNTPIKFSDWITGLPINKRRFIVPQYMQQLFNLPEELKLNIVSPSIREILAPNLILTEEMCQVLNYPGLEGISVDTIAFPFWTKFKHLPKKEEYRVAYQICFTLNLMREDKEPEKSAITLVRRIRRDLYNNLINKFIVPLFTDVNRVNFNAKYYLVQNNKQPIAVFKDRTKAEDYVLMLRQLMYVHGIEYKELVDILKDKIPKFDILEIGGSDK